MDKKKTLKLIFLLVFLGFAFYVFRGPLAGDISKEALREFMQSFGALAPLVYILIYIIGTCLLFPGTLITASGAILFGTFWGTVLTLIGASIGASGAFFIARLLGKDFVDSIIKGNLDKYNNKIEKKGFATIFYLRLIFFPFNALNFGAGLTKVKFKDYFWATLLGIIPGTFIFNYFFDSITNVMSARDLLSFSVIFPVVLFIASFFIPVLVKKYSKP